MEDEASKVGEVYIDRILLLLCCVCIYIIIGEIEGSGRGRQCLSILKILVTDTREEINFEPHLREV